MSSIYGGIRISLSGMRSASNVFSTISDSLANSRTVGYKAVRSRFIDLYIGSGAGLGGGELSNGLGGVTTTSLATNDVQGDITSSRISTHMAISGQGFFVVQAAEGEVDGNPQFSGNDIYTRAGDFELDKSGYMRNAAGLYLKGQKVDRDTGNVSGSLPDIIKIPNDFLTAKPTKKIEYRANLADLPKTDDYDENIADSELFKVEAFSNDPRNAGDGFVQANESGLFLDQSIAGGAITVFDENGSSYDVQFRWIKTDSVTSGEADKWEMFYLIDRNATGTAAKYKNVGQEFIFTSNGQLNPPIYTFNIPNLTIDGVNLGSIDIIPGDKGITQFSDNNGTVRVTEIKQDGYKPGELVNVSVSDVGRVVGSYSNGQNVDLYEVTVMEFTGANKLDRMNASTFEATRESGDGRLAPSSRIVGSSTESSNVDVSEQYSLLMLTQQYHRANTKSFSIGNNMLDEVTNLIR